MGPELASRHPFSRARIHSTSTSDQRQRIWAYDFGRIFDFEAITGVWATTWRWSRSLRGVFNLGPRPVL